MFSVELTFAIDILVKWFNVVFKPTFNELSKVKKQTFLEDNPIDWPKEKCAICDPTLGVNLKEGNKKTKKLTTWWGFTVQKDTYF